MAALLLMTGCRSAFVHEEKGGDSASISFLLTIPAPEVNTKAGYADGNVSPTDAATWADWERFVDGQLLYRVTLFLVRSTDDCLVGYRDFYWTGSAINDYSDNNVDMGYNGFCTVNSNGTFNSLLPNNSSNKYGTAVMATFNYNHPMHGSAEKLVSASYKLYVVANYSSISAADENSVNHTYAGLKDCGGPSSGQGLTEFINNTITAFTASSTGISDFSTTCSSILDYEVKSAKLDGSNNIVYSGGTEQYVCEQRPQPLTMVKDLAVLSGDNPFSGELIRTYSRIRVKLTNESQNNNLTLHSFSFLSNIAQSHAPLFKEGTYYSSDEGRPVISSPVAIHPYPGDDLVLNAADPGDPYEELVLFDGYILETDHTGDGYDYSIDVEYVGISSDQLILVDGNPIRTKESLKSYYDRGFTNFLIWNQQAIANKYGAIYDGDDDASKQYVYAKNTGTISGLVRAFGEDDGMFGVNTSTKKVTTISGEEYSQVRIDGDLMKYVWQIEETSSLVTWNGISSYDTYNFKNVGTDKYWKDDIGIDSSHHSDPFFLTTSSAEFAPYIVFNLTYDGGSLSFSNTNGKLSGGKRDNNYGFLSCGSTSNGDKGAVYSKGKQDNSYRGWLMYACQHPNRVFKDIPIQVIDPSTGVPYDLEKIKRNDFIRIDMSVVFHPDGGVLKFIVNPWESGDGDIVFE